MDIDKLGDTIKDRLKWQTSLRWMARELANREKVSEGCRQEFLKECYQHIKRELMHKDVATRHRAVEKARYLWMIGYDMSKVCSLMVIEQMSLKGWHKYNGYQAAMCMFINDDELVGTVANLVKADLRQAPGGQEVIGWQWDGTTLTTMSLTAGGRGMTAAAAAAAAAGGDKTARGGPHTWLTMRLACMATAVLGDNVTLAATVEEDVLMLTGHPCIDVRARAVLAVYRCMLVSPSVRDRGLERIVGIAGEAREITMQLASVSVLCELVARRPRQYGARLVPFLYSLLRGGGTGEADGPKVVNWIKLKILRAISLAVQSEPSLANLPDTEDTMLNIITLPSSNISLIIEGLLMVASALHSHDSLVRLSLQRAHELFQDARWKTDLSVMTLLNAVLLQINVVKPGLVRELGLEDIAQAAQMDGNTVSILRTEIEDGGEDVVTAAPAGAGEEEALEGVDGGGSSLAGGGGGAGDGEGKAPESSRWAMDMQGAGWGEEEDGW